MTCREHPLAGSCDPETGTSVSGDRFPTYGEASPVDREVHRLTFMRRTFPSEKN